MSDLSPDLPQELVTDILLRLPAKSIGQFRCVSKPWRSLLSTPHFIKSHMTLQDSHDPEKFILVSSSDHCLYTLTLTPATTTTTSNSNGRHDAVSRKISFLECQDKWDTVVGSCHGLVLVENNERGKFLINPTTLELVRVPKSPLTLDAYGSFSMHGFGYDDYNDDYKVVTLSYYDTDNEHEPDCADTFIDVYSFKMRNWKRIGPSPYDHAVPEISSGVFLNGALHWLACDTGTQGYASVIAAFCLEIDEFEEVPPPSSLDKAKFVFNKLVNLGGCLALVVDDYYGQVDVWVMKEYGVQESWTKFTVNAPEDSDMIKPICQLRDEKIVLEQDGEKLAYYSLTEETWKDMVVAGLPDIFEYGVVSYSETLLSPNFYSGNEE